VAAALGVAALLLADVGAGQPRTARGLRRPARLRGADEHVLSVRDIYAPASRGPGEDQFRLHDQPLRRRAASSAVTGIIEQRWGWGGATVLATIMVAAAGLLWLGDLRRR